VSAATRLVDTRGVSEREALECKNLFTINVEFYTASAPRSIDFPWSSWDRGFVPGASG
jgi:hypothetical protein